MAPLGRLRCARNSVGKKAAPNMPWRLEAMPSNSPRPGNSRAKTIACLACIATARAPGKAMPHTVCPRRLKITNRVPVVDCCANTPCARAQLGPLWGSSSSASTAACSAVMSPISSIAIARLLSLDASRSPARDSVSATRVVCNVAKTAISASGSSATLRMTNSFAPVGQRATKIRANAVADPGYPAFPAISATI